MDNYNTYSGPTSHLWAKGYKAKTEPRVEMNLESRGGSWDQSIPERPLAESGTEPTLDTLLPRVLTINQAMSRRLDVS